VSDDLTKGMARTICQSRPGVLCCCDDPASQCTGKGDDEPGGFIREARAAWAYALAALMTPGEGPLRAAFGNDPRALECWQAGVGVFAARHGVELPVAAPQEPGTGGLGPGSVKDAPEPGTAPGGPLAARGTPGGDAP
jgi:hypothetical protein